MFSPRPIFSTRISTIKQQKQAPYELLQRRGCNPVPMNIPGARGTITTFMITW